MDQTSPAARRAFLDGLGEPSQRAQGDSGFLHDLAEAERAVALCERDWYEAHGAALAARADAPEAEQAVSRYLAPEARSRYVAYLQAEEGDQRAEQAYYAARSRLSRLLAAYGDIQRPDLGLPPGLDWDPGPLA